MSDKWHGGKGDRNRTKDIAKFNENFERIFGTKERLKKFEKNFAENITKPETIDIETSDDTDPFKDSPNSKEFMT